jgi:TolB-like protein/Flp pilus assembly protein TadD
MMSKEKQKAVRYYFDDVVIDGSNFLVMKAGVAKKITPRAFEVLLYLLKERGRLVEKQELFEAVWKESFVTDNALTRMVKEIRQVIGDAADAPRYIETVPKRGYRFIAATSLAAPQSEHDAHDAEDAPITSIAVLPFVNLSEDPDKEYLSEGITESIINSLSRISGLRVVPRSTVFYYQGKDLSPQEIARELNVRAIVTGRLLQREGTLVIKTELVDALKELQLWGEHYRRNDSDLFVVQEEISREISEKLRLKLPREEQERLTRRQTESPEAYQLYLKGRYFWNRRPHGLKKGIEYFERALDQDPQYALALSGLADSYSTLGSWENGGLPPNEAMPRARAAALKALEIDGNLAEAHTTLAYTQMHYDWNLAEAEANFERAFELNPNYVHANHWYSHYCMARGRVEDSLVFSKRSLELAPLDLIINVHMAWHYWLARDPDEALRQSEKTRELDQNIIWPGFFAGLAYEQKGMFEESILEFQKAQALSGEVTFLKAAQGHVLGRSGQKQRARLLLRELETMQEKKYVPAYDFAMIHLGLEENDLALEWLRKARMERSGWLAYVKMEPRLDALRSRTEFADLTESE